LIAKRYCVGKEKRKCRELGGTWVERANMVRFGETGRL
jgi:hypothetical protein